MVEPGAEKSDSKASLGEDFWLQELVYIFYLYIFKYFLLMLAENNISRLISSLG